MKPDQVKMLNQHDARRSVDPSPVREVRIDIDRLAARRCPLIEHAARQRNDEARQVPATSSKKLIFGGVVLILGLVAVGVWAHSHWSDMKSKQSNAADRGDPTVKGSKSNFDTSTESSSKDRSEDGSASSKSLWQKAKAFATHPAVWMTAALPAAYLGYNAYFAKDNTVITFHVNKLFSWGVTPWLLGLGVSLLTAGACYEYYNHGVGRVKKLFDFNEKPPTPGSNASDGISDTASVPPANDKQNCLSGGGSADHPSRDSPEEALPTASELPYWAVHKEPPPVAKAGQVPSTTSVRERYLRPTGRIERVAPPPPDDQ